MTGFSASPTRALRLDEFDRPVHMQRRFRMKTDRVRARFRKGDDERIDRHGHQMHVDRHARMRPDRRTHERPDRQIRHVMVVHYVEMNPVRAGYGDVANLVGETRKSADSSEGAIRKSRMMSPCVQ